MSGDDPRPDDPFDALFDGVGPRPQPHREARDRAFAAVTEEWQALLARRRKVRRFATAAAAAVALAGVVGLVVLRQPAAPAVTMELAQGHVRVDGESHRASGEPVPVAVGAGVAIRALGPARWLAANGADVRVGTGTEFSWRAPGVLALDRGVVYVATEGRGTFAVETGHGVVNDVGTRFVVAADDDRLEVAVREGRIELTTRGGTRRTAPVAAGRAQVLVADGGVVDERSEPAGHARWNWIHAAPKGYAMRDPLAMLAEIARDQGRELRFAAGVEAALRGQELDGDFRGLAPWAALRQATNATATGWRDENGVLTIVSGD